MPTRFKPKGFDPELGDITFIRGSMSKEEKDKIKRESKEKVDLYNEHK